MSSLRLASTSMLYTCAGVHRLSISATCESRLAELAPALLDCLRFGTRPIGGMQQPELTSSRSTNESGRMVSVQAQTWQRSERSDPNTAIRCSQRFVTAMATVDAAPAGISKEPDL
eukprot:4242328-Prymnesium_polylepis.1